MGNARLHFANARIIALSVLLGVTACVHYTRPGDPEKVVYALYEDIKDWDPATAFSLEVMVLGNIYEPLHWYVADSTGGYHFRPALATRYEHSNDGLHWTFYLRSGVMFHDGQPFTALAVKRSVERVKRLNRGAAYIWDAVEAIDTPNDTTIVFHLRYPAPMDLITAAQYSAWIVSPAVADCTTAFFRSGKAAGTGPYRLTRWEPGRRVVLSQFKPYWGGWQGRHFKTVEFRLVSDAATRVQLIRRGDVDFAGLIPVENIAAMRHMPELEVQVVPSWRNMMFLLNTQKPPLDNLYFRKALQYAFDYTAAVQYVLGGTATPAIAPVPKTMWGHATDLNMPRLDLDKARHYLQLSGIKPDTVRLTLRYVASVNAYEQCALMLQNNLAKLGIRLELQPGLWNVIWEQARQLKTAPHMISMTWWPTYPTPGDWLKGLFHTQEPNLFNLSYYHNSRFDSLVDAAMRLEATDRPKAIQLYQEAQKMLVDDAVAIFFADLMVRFVKRRSVSPLHPNPAYEMIYFYNLYRRTPREWSALSSVGW